MINELSHLDKALGVVKDLIFTGRDVGASREFYQILASDTDLFERVLEIVCRVKQGSKTLPPLRASEAPALFDAEELDLLSQLSIASNAAGAGRGFYYALFCDSALFRRVVQMVLSPSREDPLRAPTEALEAAVAQGVQCEGGVYRFFDPGLSLAKLYSLDCVRLRDLVMIERGFGPYKFLWQEDTPQQRTFRLDDQFPSARVIAMWHVITLLATGEGQSFEVRCLEQVEDNEHVIAQCSRTCFALDTPAARSARRASVEAFASIT